jgi:nitroreductase
MNVFTAIQNRRSIRKYSGRPVEEEKLQKILEAARLSPSASNLQNWKFIVVRDPAIRGRMLEAAYNQPFVGQAPVILVACGTDPKSVMSCGQPKHSIDLSIATAYMILEAVEQGLGTCWLGRFHEDMVKDILGIPDEVRVVAVVPLGYADESPDPRERKKTEEIVCYDRFKK